jgi:hypothetical protein
MGWLVLGCVSCDRVLALSQFPDTFVALLRSSYSTGCRYGFGFPPRTKSILNEFITFAAVCLCAPLAYAATTGTLSATAMGLWVLNTLYFSSSIFTVKLRKPKTSSIVPGVVYHAIATLIVTILYYLGWLPVMAALVFGLALLKFGLITWNQEWYRTVKIQWVAMIETGTALSFLIIVALSLLPAHLTRF